MLTWSTLVVYHADPVCAAPFRSKYSLFYRPPTTASPHPIPLCKGLGLGLYGAVDNRTCGAELKPDHQKRSIWITFDLATNETRIFLEKFSPSSQVAYDFLMAIAEPVNRQALPRVCCVFAAGLSCRSFF